MAISRWSNPFSFTPGPVTIICSALYLTVIATILVTHSSVPPAPATVPYLGVNLTEAWQDLQTLTDGFRPFNSRRNDEIHDWLLQRLSVMLAENGATVEHSAADPQTQKSTSADVTIFNDRISNMSFSIAPSIRPATGNYFESTNIMVYIRGRKDEPGEWWQKNRHDGPSGVLINAHYDSVATGFGATDDGMGVISVMQVMKHFSVPENRPRHGIVALLNNGEEDYLNGARAFARHPLSRFPTAFLNLEGAGAGGRAAIFRSTDAGVTRAYKGTEHPCGTVIVNDGFKRKLVRSETDYAIFHGDMGLRGIDVAFVEPRARYHTVQDDTRHASVDSLWHMLSAALHTMQSLSDQQWEKGAGADGVWLDLLGDSFVDMELHTLFALSVTLLVVAPVLVIAAVSFLSSSDKLWIFSLSRQTSRQKISLHGLHGFFRAPFIIGVPSTILIGLTLLLVKVNPFIIHSSPYSVWSMMLSVWIFSAWFLAKTADFARPSALHRLYSWLWMFLLFWILLVVATVVEDNAGIASGYFIVWNFFTVSLATLVGLLELQRLETRTEFAERQTNEPGSIPNRRGSAVSKNRRISAAGSARLSTRFRDDETGEEAIEEDPTETTSLLGSRQRATFANYASSIPESHESRSLIQPFEYEQEWSAKLPSWTWILQLVLAMPLSVILIGQIGLAMTTGLYQTLTDGSSPLVVYISIAVLAVFILLPLVPVLHRFTYHIPTFLLFVFLGTLIYNLVAFPFSPINPLKVFFVQEVNLDTGINHVRLGSTDNPYIWEVVKSLPSSTGKMVHKSNSRRADLFDFFWEGIPPRVVPSVDPLVPPELGYGDWLSFNSTRVSINQARFVVRGRNTRSCRLIFDKHISDFSVAGGATDARFPTYADSGISQIRLWSREWEATWDVTVTWPPPGADGNNSTGSGQDGRVVCLWNAAHEGQIPALDEFRRFAPSWSIDTKLDDGLVEGYKTFLV